LEDRDADGKMKLKYVSKAWVVKVWTGLIWHRMEKSQGIFVNAVMKNRIS
jgi:hypothetical protein